MKSNVMRETTISLEEKDWNLLDNYHALGFSTSGDLLSKALELLRADLNRMQEQTLIASAQIYTETYAEDAEMKDWNEATNQDWE